MRFRFSTATLFRLTAFSAIWIAGAIAGFKALHMIANDIIAKDELGDWELTNKGNELFRRLMSERPLFDE